MQRNLIICTLCQILLKITTFLPHVQEALNQISVWRLAILNEGFFVFHSLSKQKLGWYPKFGQNCNHIFIYFLLTNHKEPE
jgi:hypothetical protein